MSLLVFDIPLVTVSGANAREHPMERHKRVAREKRATLKAFPKVRLPPVFVFHLTRCAPRELDDDNLRSALKHVRDAIAARCHFDDRADLIRFLCGQAKSLKGEEHVHVEGYRVEGGELVPIPEAESWAAAPKRRAPAKKRERPTKAPATESALERMRRLATPNVRGPH